MGQRKFGGPPPDWEGPNPSSPGHEVRSRGAAPRAAAAHPVPSATPSVPFDCLDLRGTHSERDLRGRPDSAVRGVWQDLGSASDDGPDERTEPRIRLCHFL